MKVIFGTDAIKYPLTGIGRYAFELAKCLSRSQDISELCFLRAHKLTTQLPVARESSLSTDGIKQYLKKIAWLLKYIGFRHRG